MFVIANHCSSPARIELSPAGILHLETQTFETVTRIFSDLDCFSGLAWIELKSLALGPAGANGIFKFRT